MELDADTVSRIDEAVAAAMEKYKAPGAMVGVWIGEDTAFVKCYGLADDSSGLPMSEDLDFRIGSITKTFTGNVVLQLADEGALSLEDPVSAYVEGVPDGDRITVRMLLGNTSGIFNYGEDAGLNQTLAGEPHKVWRPEELVAVAVANPPYFPPGEGCRYSNTNFILLGMIVEKVTGRPFAEVLGERVIVPLGLSDTYMAEGFDLQGESVRGYQYDPETGELFDGTDYLDQSITWTAGGMVSELASLRSWSKALVSGELLKADTREAMTAELNLLPYTEEYFGYPMRYGLAIIDFGGWLGHSGMEVGYTTSMFELPSRDATVVVFLNGSDIEEPSVRLFMQVAEIVFPDETPW